MDAELKAFLENVVSHVDARIDQQTVLIQQIKESLEREMTQLSAKVDRMEARLEKIAAGAHYVTRLVEWSEKQDNLQADILRRVQTLERRVDEIQGRQ